MSEVLNANIPIYTIKAGSTSVQLPIYVVTSYPAETCWKGAILPYEAESGYNLQVVYYRQGASAAATITTVDGTVDWISGGVYNLSNKSAALEGFVLLGLPDAAVAVGADWVLIGLRYYTDGGIYYVNHRVLIHLVDYDPQDGVRLGLTSLPNAAAAANGGLPTTNATKLNQTVDLTSGQSIACSDKTGFSLSTAGIQAIWDALTSALTTAGSVGKKLADWVLGTDNKALISANTHTGGATIAGSTTVGSVTGAVGSVTGAVGSVTGAVGSVTGNVGGNVTGNVGGTVNGFTTTAKAQIQTEVSDALDAAIPAVPTTGSINQLIKDYLDGKISDIDTSSWTAAPTAVAIRQEIDANSTKLAQLLAKVLLFGSGVAQSLNPVLAADRLFIVSGDDYSSTDSRALTWTENGGGWGTLAGTITLEIVDCGSYACTYSGTAGSQVITCQLTKAQTAAMPVGTHEFNLIYTTTSGSRTISLVYKGKCDVVGQVIYVAA